MTDLLDGRPFRILCGDAVTVLRTLPASSVHCVVTSPPYWGLRDYGAEGQIGLERTFPEYVERLVAVFREVRRVLRDDGTLWLNLGDKYATRWGSRRDKGRAGLGDEERERSGAVPDGLKEKDLVGIPWMVAFALRADGWHLRAEIIWHKPNAQPESVKDRPGRAHEHLFLLSKRQDYFYDGYAVKEPAIEQRAGNSKRRIADGTTGDRPADHLGRGIPWSDDGSGRNRRTVWTVTTKGFDEAHFAVMAPEVVEPCILAGTSEHGVCCECGAPWERVVERREAVSTGAAIGGDPARRDGGTRERDTTGRGGNRLAVRNVGTDNWRPGCEHDAAPVPAVVLDPFSGAGTTALVATRLRRRALGIELNPDYVAMSERRIRGDAPLFLGVA